MSDAGNILTALTTDIETAISGVTVQTDPTTFEEMTSGQLPACAITLVEYEAEAIAYGQEERAWTIVGVVAQSGGTREQMQTKLEAIRDQVFADTTLGGSVDRSVLVPAVPFSHEDSQMIFGEFAVRAEKVV